MALGVLVNFEFYILNFTNFLQGNFAIDHRPSGPELVRLDGSTIEEIDLDCPPNAQALLAKPQKSQIKQKDDQMIRTLTGQQKMVCLDMGQLTIQTIG